MDCSQKSKGAVGAVAALPDDPVVEILSRVPAKSVCRFKCVSKAWRDLIAHPDHPRSVPLDIDPGFSFLTERPDIQWLVLLDSCNGLILFRQDQVHPYSAPLGYIVCNPTTKRWVVVPTCECQDLRTCAYLAFDQGVSSHFHLVQFQISLEDEMLVAIDSYSSETGTWTRNQIDSQENRGPWAEWYLRAMLSRFDTPECAFVNGFLHFIIGDSGQPQIAAVDLQGRAKRVITVPSVADRRPHQYCFLGQSQGCLHYMTQEMFDAHEERYMLSIWVLQDYDSQEWLLKDNVSIIEIFGHSTSQIDLLVGIHQDRNVVFFSELRSNKLIAYDMDHKEVSVIATLEDTKLLLKLAHFVPCFSESPALTN